MVRQPMPWSVAVGFHGSGARSQQRDHLRAVAGEPVPFGLQVPQRLVGEDDERLHRVERLQVAGQPSELGFADPLRIGHIVQRDEMDALVVEAPVRRAERFLEGGALIGRGIVLAGQEDRSQPGQRPDDLLELGHALAANRRVVGLVREVAGEHHEVGRLAQRRDGGDGLL
jgi:hypothetical protein